MLLYMMEMSQKNNKAEGATQEVAPEPIHEEVETKVVVEEKAPKMTRADIMKMNVATVRAYAEEQGIEGAPAMSGAELKRILVNRLFEEE